MAKKKYKLGWGDESKISSAISSGLLDGGDLVVTKDTKRIAFIDPSTESIYFLKANYSLLILFRTQRIMPRPISLRTQAN